MTPCEGCINDFNASSPRPPRAPGVVTISCVGDSITAGGWPQIMQASLNAKYPGKYNVINFGECGSTMQRGADSPYVERASWPRVLNTSAQILVIMLGTNDSKDKSDGGVPNWENDGKTGQAEYVADYAWMVEQFKTRVPGGAPDIYATIPVPNYKPGVYGMNHSIINNIFPVIVPQIAAANTPNAALDIFDCMGGVNLTHPEWSGDGCHPNAAGYRALAGCFQAALGL